MAYPVNTSAEEIALIVEKADWYATMNARAGLGHFLAHHWPAIRAELRASAVGAGAREAMLVEALGEIANRAGNFMDADAADWMPSIYKIACEAIGSDPWPMLEANPALRSDPVRRTIQQEGKLSHGHEK